MSGPLGQCQDHAEAVRRACDLVTRALGEAAKRPEVTSFFDEPTNTVSHIVRGPASRRCGVIDSVLDYDAASGRTATESADELIAFIQEQGLEVVARVENLDDNFTVTMKTKLAAGESRCPSLVGVWRGANWMEREGYDMFGIQYEGHPDLRRILLPQDWEGHPLLKSYAVDTPHPPYR